MAKDYRSTPHMYKLGGVGWRVTRWLNRNLATPGRASNGVGTAINYFLLNTNAAGVEASRLD